MVLHTESGDPRCWGCSRVIPATRLAVETVLCSRPAAEGGPYRMWRCEGCGEESGALRNEAGRWALHPLEGLGDPTLLDRLVPRRSRASLEAAQLWWRRHASAVERFRREPGDGSRTQPRREARPHPRPRKATAAHPKSATAPPPPPRPAPEPPQAAAPEPLETRAPHDLLGIAPDAAVDEIRRAYRAALKLCHPDRVANLDPEIQDLANRKARALRRAYETLLARQGAH